MSGILAKEKAALAKEEGKLKKLFKAVQKFLSKEFLWVLFVALLALPLAYLIEYVLRNYMYEVYCALENYMEDKPAIIGTYVIGAAGVYFARTVSGAVSVAFKKPEKL